MYTETRKQGFGDEVARRILIGTYVLSAGYYDAYYIKASKVRRCILDDFTKAFTKVDALLTPTTPTPAFAIEDKPDFMTMYMNDVLTVPASMAGLPACNGTIVGESIAMLLDVGEGHRLYVSEQSPTPNRLSAKSSAIKSAAKSAIFLHGGPGGASSLKHFEFFPKSARVVRFDQRGCGKSKFQTRLQHNTTERLVADMEKIRNELGIEKWLVFGGSWGSTLALCYALAHPNRVTGLVLRGVFLGTKAEMEWAFEQAAPTFMPELMAKVGCVKALAKKVLAGDAKAMRIWGAYENCLSCLKPADFKLSAKVPNSPLLECHYAANNFFIKKPILKQVTKIRHLKAIIIQGRYDLLCPPKTAFALAQTWGKNCQLKFINDAGHSAFEPSTLTALKRAVRKLL